MIEVLPAVLTAGVSFAIGQFIVSNYVGPELTASLAALFSLASVALLLRVWRPREEYVEGGAAVAAAHNDPPARVARAYGTYGILIVVVLAGQIGNFAGLSNLEPPLNLTALFRCGQIGNRLVSRAVGRRARGDPTRRDSASRSGSSTGPAPTGSTTAVPPRSSSASRRSSRA